MATAMTLEVYRSASTVQFVGGKCRRPGDMGDKSQGAVSLFLPYLVLNVTRERDKKGNSGYKFCFL